MTRSRYLLALVLQKFGVTLKTRRLTEASYEAHLMQDGEEILGAFCWREVGEIEELSFEYWTLRGLDRKRKELLEKINRAEARMTEAQERKMAIRRPGQNEDHPPARQRAELAEKLESLREQAKAISARAQQTRKKHEALKVKLRILKEEGSASEEEVASCRTGLAELRETFSGQKEELDEITQKIASDQSRLRALDERLGKELQLSESEANEAYGAISQANRDITNFQAELSTIEEEQAKLFRDIGHFLNLQSKRSDCQTVCKKHRALLTQLKLLFQSIQLNRALSERLD